ncbi:MAG: hypothetical protein ACR2QE_03545 [Acidimicrobiales bacterium]
MTVRTHTRSIRLVVALTVAALTAALLGTIEVNPAGAGVDHGALVAEQPRLDTPDFENGIVHSVRQIGDRIFVGGSFTQITKADGTTVNQAYMAAYNAHTGALDESFAPVFDREVRSIHVAAGGAAIFVGGKFNNVNGFHRTKIAKLDMAGNTLAAFRANASAVVTGLTVGNGNVYLTGSFKKVDGVDRLYLAAVDSVTGAVDPNFDIPLSGPLGVGNAIGGKEVDITSDQSTLLVVSTARQFDGLDRYGLGLIDLTGPTAEVSPWRTRLYQDNVHRCSGGWLQLRDGEISPDDSYFVVVSKGHDRPPACDTAVKFPMTADPDNNTDPHWVSRHFDSVYSVAISDVAVYTGGHFRYMESPTSPDPWPGNTNTTYLNPAVLGSDVVPREQIGALDPATGKALDWVTSTNSFQAVLALETAPAGLLLGHDRQLIGNFDIGRHGVFPLEVADAADPTVTVDAPSENSVHGEAVTITGTAADDVSVIGVFVAIVDRDNGTWLRSDGTWGAWQKLPATVLSPGAPSTGYTFGVTLPDGRFKAKVWAVDSSGKTTTPRAARKFEVNTIIDLEDPTVTITNPVADSVIGPNLLLGGTASDDVAVDEVWAAIYDRDAKLWLRVDGTWGAWQKLPTTLSAGGTPDTGFNLTRVLPDARYKVNVWAIDSSGKDTTPRESVKFEVA